MKTDRELLELAGKAADIPARVIGAYPGSYNCDDRGWHPQWNPLENDGDALRLAVKLRTDIELDHIGSAVLVNRTSREKYIDHADENEATRRAIVRAAAAIGEAML